MRTQTASSQSARSGKNWVTAVVRSGTSAVSRVRAEKLEWRELQGCNYSHVIPVRRQRVLRLGRVWSGVHKVGTRGSSVQLHDADPGQGLAHGRGATPLDPAAGCRRIGDVGHLDR